MDHSVKVYLQRLPTEKLEKFLQDYMNNKLEEDFSIVIGEVAQELAHRKEETPSK